MAGMKDEAGRGRDNPALAEGSELFLKLDQLLSDGADLSIEELDRRAKVVSNAVKARQGLLDMKTQETSMRGEDDRLDAAGEQRLRQELLGRLDALAVELEQKGVRRCTECGRFDFGSEGLEKLVPSGAVGP